MDDARDELVFREEEAPGPETCPEPLVDTWKVLIVDDEEEVHNVTRLVLRDLTYAGRPLAFLGAYSAVEARRMLAAHMDTAIVLLDVVMEENDAGLTLVKYIREELGNRFTRIILRTGQPGQAPEERVIVEYDINDYKEKTELTAQKLVTTIISALRTFRDIQTIEASRRGLEKIVEASADIFQRKSMVKFTTGVLTQLTSLLNLRRNAIFCQASGFAATGEEGRYVILAATGEFQRHIGRDLKEVVNQQVYGSLMEAALRKNGLLCDQGARIGYFKSGVGSESFIYLEGGQELSDIDRQLVEIFFSNVSIAFDNIDLNKEMEDTQKEIIFTLGETVECRSLETGHHVRRVSEYVRLLASKMGLPEEECEKLHMATPLHDLGKLATPDSILHKPGPLTAAEFDTVKSHAMVGSDLLHYSHRDIIKAAAIIAAQHHERYDGTGYPAGLAGEDIHIYGRICAVADVFDALMSNRVYREAWPLEKVVAHFQDMRGRHFDPRITDIFLENLDEFMAIWAKYLDGDETCP